MNSSYELPLDYAHTARFYVLCLKQFYPAMADGAAVNNNLGHDKDATNRRRSCGQPAIAPITPLSHQAAID
jgi:hypothetical protein